MNILHSFTVLLMVICIVSCGLKPNINSLSLPDTSLKLEGCLQNLAINYNSKAIKEDGSCLFKGCTLFDEELKNQYSSYVLQYPQSRMETTCPDPIVDIHNQFNRPQVGILWVVDNSLSMDDEINNLANNFYLFINEFANSPLEFVMGITTTDSQHVSSSLKKLSSTIARNNRTQFIQNFKELIQVGTDGSSTEKGYQAAKDFIQQYGYDFLDPQSYLSIIFISDEADQSQKNPQEYLDFFSAQVSSSNKFRSHAIVDLDNSGGEDSSKGSRYLYSVNKSQGIKGDVQGNFAQILKDIGKNIVELKKNFPLSAKPFVPSLEVRVNNVLISNWTYLASENSLTITPVPDYAAEIKITYTPLP